MLFEASKNEGNVLLGMPGGSKAAARPTAVLTQPLDRSALIA